MGDKEVWYDGWHGPYVCAYFKDISICMKCVALVHTSMFLITYSIIGEISWWKFFYNHWKNEDLPRD